MYCDEDLDCGSRAVEATTTGRDPWPSHVQSPWAVSAVKVKKCAAGSLRYLSAEEVGKNGVRRESASERSFCDM